MAHEWTVKKMRLINGDLISNLPEDVPDQYKGKEADAYLDGIGYVLKSLDNLPDIDPETLPIVRELRAELRQYKDLGVTPEQIALLMNFFKERTSAKWIATDMELVADSLQKGNLEKRLVQVTKERDVAVKERDEYKAALQNWHEGE